jgi:hypothetical protein
MDHVISDAVGGSTIFFLRGATVERCPVASLVVRSKNITGMFMLRLILIMQEESQARFPLLYEVVKISLFSESAQRRKDDVSTHWLLGHDCSSSTLLYIPQLM